MDDEHPEVDYFPYNMWESSVVGLSAYSIVMSACGDFMHIFLTFSVLRVQPWDATNSVRHQRMVKLQ